MLKLLKLVKLLRVVRFAKFMEAFETSFAVDYSVLQIVQHILTVVLATHWVCCALLLFLHVEVRCMCYTIGSMPDLVYTLARQFYRLCLTTQAPGLVCWTCQIGKRTLLLCTFRPTH